MMLTRTEILQKLNEGKNCAQITFGYFADQLGYDVEETDALAAVFGGGMRRGNVCGTCTGAYMALGSYAKEHDPACELAGKFDQVFIEKNGSLLCKELTGYDFSIPGQHEAAVEAGVVPERCPGFIATAIELVDKLIAEQEAKG